MYCTVFRKKQAQHNFHWRQFCVTENTLKKRSESSITVKADQVFLSLTNWWIHYWTNDFPCWFNNPFIKINEQSIIFIFIVNLIIECWFDYCFLKNYTFHKSTSEFCSFFFFSKSQVRASSEVQTHTNCQALLSCLPRNISLIILLR